jgi:putative transposase
MYLTNIGVLADVFWYEIKNHAKNVVLDAFVVMPDHVHGILLLTGNDGEHGEHREPGEPGEYNDRDSETIGQRRFQNIGNNSVSSIIGSYKSAVTKHARRLGYDFNWQTRFYDHIIRDEIGLNTIRNYIDQNVRNWKSE